MSAIFKPEHVGQVVSDPYFGSGTIVTFNKSSNFPVTVHYDVVGSRIYTKDGRLLDEFIPTLQFGPLDNWERRTQPQVQDGQIIEIFRGGSWQLAKVDIIDGQRMFYNHTTHDGIRIYDALLNHNWRCAL